MALFKIGDKVLTADTNVHGTIVKVMPARRGRQLYTVNFPTGNIDVLETDLKMDFNESDPFERCKNGIYGSYAEYSQKSTTFKIKHSNNSTISSLKASKTLFRAYQFKPLLKFLNSPNRRLLVADEVGLGKTIEAGHIMLELKARRELKNVLIICPMSLQEKWKAELYEKFGLTFKIIENTKDLISDLDSRNDVVRAIINYEKIRMPREKKNGFSSSNNSQRKQNNLIEYLAENPRRFSLVLCDEAHKMRNKETQTYKGAEIVMNQADAVLFLTATPIMINEENLYNLLHLLDNTRYFNYEIFRNRMNENRPFIEAISNLNHNVELSKIKEQLTGTEIYTRFSANENVIFSCSSLISEIFKQDPIFQEIMELLGGKDTPKVRARLQYLLATMSVMNTVFSRTRKREVTTDMSQAERHPHLCKVQLYDDEQEEFNNVIEEYIDCNSYIDDWGEERLTLGGALGLVQRKRQVASSVWGFMNDEDCLNKGIDMYSERKDAKFETLLRVIKEVFANGPKKIVVFALFRSTLKYLQIRLKKAGFNSLVIHGQIQNRTEILQQFKTMEDVHILLSSEVGSEGLDMQFCNSMVNYDLPWNPMVVEQRIGRIDRFGQKSPVVNIYNIVVANSIQEEIYLRLLDRIGIFRGTIGDMEAILDAQIEVEGRVMTIQDVYNRMEKDFFTKDLTKEERERKISEVERAIENERENLKHLQEGLSNTLTNDAYFRDEINRILYNNAYVTSEELQNYISSIIKHHLTTCNMEEISKGIWNFYIPVSQPSALKNFLTQYCDNNDESRIGLSQFRQRIDNQLTFPITFSQEIAYEDSSINYLNMYHPMIQASLNYFLQCSSSDNCSFSYALEGDELLHEGQRFFMGLYQLNTHRNVQGIKKETAEMMPIVYNILKQEIEINQDVIDRLYRRSQVEGCERNINNRDAELDIIDEMRYDFAEYIRIAKKQRLEDTLRQLESDRMRNEQQTKEYYQSRIENHKRNIEDWEFDIEYYITDEKEKRGKQGAINLAKANMAQLEKERDSRLQIINEDPHLGIDEKLVSLSLITII